MPTFCNKLHGQDMLSYKTPVIFSDQRERTGNINDTNLGDQRPFKKHFYLIKTQLPFLKSKNAQFLLMTESCAAY